MEITEKIAERIINSKVLVEHPNTPYKGVEISYIGYTDAEGNPFEREDEDGDPTGEYFAIVSFKAMSPYQLEKAVEEFNNGEYEEACNHNLSMRMNVEKARELCAGTLGTLICHNVTVKDEDDEDVIALMARSFAPMEAVVAKKVTLADLLKKKAPKEEGKKDKKADKKAEKKADKKGDKKSDKKDKKVKLAEADE